MIALILEPFKFHFINNALLMLLVVTIPCALLSVFIVSKGWALTGGGVSHAILPGVVLAWIMGMPLSIGGFLAGIFCAVATGYLKNNTQLKPDTIMGIVFSGMTSVGLMLYIFVQPKVDVNYVLFGDILVLTGGEIIKTAIVMGAVLLVVLLKRRDFLAYCFDSQQAHACGLHTNLLHYSLLCLISLTIVETLKAVGVVLSVSLLITPGAVVVLLTKNFNFALLAAIIVSILTSMAGVYLSFFIDSAPSPTIVVVFAVVFITSLVISTSKIR